MLKRITILFIITILLSVICISCEEGESPQMTGVLSDETDELMPEETEKEVPGEPEEELPAESDTEPEKKTPPVIEPVKVKSPPEQKEMTEPEEPEPLPSLNFTVDKITLTENESLVLAPESVNIPADTVLVWKSSDETVAPVNKDGLVKASIPGEALITVSTPDGSALAQCTIEVTAKKVEPNYPPSRPESLTVQYMSRGFKYSAVLRWQKSTEKNGDPLTYTVYEKRGSSFAEIKTTNDTEIILHGYSEKLRFKVVAVDTKGAQSEPAYSADNSDFMLRFSTGLYLPLGEVRKIATLGVGFYLEGLWPDLFVPGVYGGVKAGYITMIQKAEATDYNYIVPVFLTLGYHYTVVPGFDLVPKTSIGMSYNALAFENDDGEYQEFSFWLPHFEAGLEGQHYINDSIDLYWGLLYNGLIDTSGLISGLGINAGINYNFR